MSARAGRRSRWPQGVSWSSLSGPVITEVRIGDVPLRPGTSMVYVFDFGDNWQFDVELERIDPVDLAMRQATLVDSHGKAPRQYHGDNEEAEWEE